MSPDLIGGDVDEGYGKVADAFRANFAAGREVGAAVAVYRDGVKVVDLWGGYRNGITKAPWQHDTMVNMFSTTKGVAALAVALAVSRGLFGYDDKVVDHWPEFAQAGKADVTVRQLLGHQAGLCVLKPAPTVRDVADPARLSAMLAAQKPAWPPGTRHGYHAITLGWYESELIRRTDPAGRTLGRFFADEIAGPLGLDLTSDFRIRWPRDRVAHLHHWSRAESLLHLQRHAGRHSLAASLNPVGLLARAGRLPSDVDALGRRLQPRRRPRHRDPVGQRDRHRRRRRQALRCRRDRRTRARSDSRRARRTHGRARRTEPRAAGQGAARRRRLSRWDCQSRCRCCIFGSSDKAFGTPGFGGSFGFADPDTGVGFAYVMNRLGFHLCSDPRELALRQALFRDVLGARPQK